MERKAAFLAKYKRLSIIPVSVITLGVGLMFGLLFIAQWLGSSDLFLLAVGGGLLAMVGFLLLILYFIGYVAIWVFQRVGATTGMIVEEAAPPPPPEPVAAGPSWRVTLPDGSHVVAYENDKPRPSRLICDGRVVDVTWPFKWRGTPEAVFTVAGHRATLVEGPDLRKSLFGLGGPGSYVYRRDLRVEGASVESLAAGAPSPSEVIESG